MQKSKIQLVFKILLTLFVFSGAICTSTVLWNRYMHSAWTRDGRIRANVIDVAPDVSGAVTAMAVKDNQFVHKGELLFVIDQERYRLALAQAESLLLARKAELNMRRHEARRRSALGSDVVSHEDRENALALAESADALHQEAMAAVALAQLNLKRTEVRSPVEGYVTNLSVHAGDYVNEGVARMAVIDKNSFWVYGYFEENKLSLFHPGDKVEIRLLGTNTVLPGRVESFSRGITDRDNPAGRELLANVDPVFQWVRLAQRVPVRISIDSIPEDIPLAAGMTCTLVVTPAKEKRVQEISVMGDKS